MRSEVCRAHGTQDRRKANEQLSPTARLNASNWIRIYFTRDESFKMDYDNNNINIDDCRLLECDSMWLL
jgi:hypothetical protein